MGKDRRPHHFGPGRVWRVGLAYSLHYIRIPGEKNSLLFASASWDSGTLDLLTGHVDTEFGLSSLEESMRVLPKCWTGTILDPRETVDIELTNERLVLNLGEEFGKSLLSKFVRVQDLEGSAIWHPRDVCQVLIMARILAHMIEHFMETKGKVKLKGRTKYRRAKRCECV